MRRKNTPNSVGIAALKAQEMSVNRLWRWTDGEPADRAPEVQNSCPALRRLEKLPRAGRLERDKTAGPDGRAARHIQRQRRAGQGHDRNAQPGAQVARHRRQTRHRSQTGVGQAAAAGWRQEQAGSGVLIRAANNAERPRHTDLPHVRPRVCFDARRQPSLQSVS